MNYLLKVSEVVEAAISIEENGRRFIDLSETPPKKKR
jgi:biotin synthase-like enzyme